MLVKHRVDPELKASLRSLYILSSGPAWELKTEQIESGFKGLLEYKRNGLVWFLYPVLRKRDKCSSVHKQAHMFTLQVAMPKIPITGTEEQKDWVPAQPRIRKRLFSQTTTRWGCSSMTKCFTSMPKTLGLTQYSKKTRTETWSYWLAPFIVTH